MQDQVETESDSGFKQNIEGRISAALLCGLCLIIFLQILGRFGLFPGQVWTEELTRWMWVWMALIGCAAAEAERDPVCRVLEHEACTGAAWAGGNGVSRCGFRVHPKWSKPSALTDCSRPSSPTSSRPGCAVMWPMALTATPDCAAACRTWAFAVGAAVNRSS